MHAIFLKYRASPWLIALALASVSTGALLAADGFSPEALPRSFSTQPQLVGINLVLILMPAYLVWAWGIAHRRSHVLIGTLDPSGEGQRAMKLPQLWVWIGLFVGGCYAIFFNLPVSSVAQMLEGGHLLTTLVVLMVAMWLWVGALLASRIHTALVLRKLGRSVPIDPYRQTNLEPFAKNGLGDVLLTVGALVLTALQSMDAEFRYQNYMYALIVAVPAAATLLLLPMTTVRGRLRQRKREELAKLEELIAASSKRLEPEPMARLELLMQRRDRVLALRTWPFNVSVVYRLVIYGVIPPIAWTAAALVEVMLEGMLGE